MPYHGDDGSNLRIHPGYRKNGGYPELRDYGKPAAGRIFLAGWRHSGIYPATCRQRKDQEYLPYLFAIDAGRFHRYRVPYHPDTKRPGKPYLSTSPPALRSLAVECDRQKAQSGIAHRQDIRIHIACRIRSKYHFCLDRFHTACRPAYHLVDHAAYLRAYHHLLRGMAQRICQA